MFTNAPARFQGFSYTTASRGANDPQVGDMFEDGDEKYIFVYNAGNSTIAQCKGAVLSAVSGYSVTVSSTTQADYCVGVAKHSSISTANYGFLMTRGFTQVYAQADCSITTGALIVLGDAGAFVEKSISTGFMAKAVGKAMTSIASAVTGTAFINIM